MYAGFGRRPPLNHTLAVRRFPLPEPDRPLPTQFLQSVIWMHRTLQTVLAVQCLLSHTES
jgi:hypothetical protein